MGRCQCGSGDPFFDTSAAAIRSFMLLRHFQQLLFPLSGRFWRRYARMMPTRPTLVRACFVDHIVLMLPCTSPHGSTDTLQQGTEEEWLGPFHRGYTNRPSVSNHSLVEFHRRVKKMPWSKLVAVSLDALDFAASDMQQWEMTFLST